MNPKQFPNHNSRSKDEAVSAGIFSETKSNDPSLDASNLFENVQNCQSSTSDESSPIELSKQYQFSMMAWLAIWLLLALFTFAIFDLFQTIKTAYETLPYWAMIMSISALGVVSVLGVIIYSELRGIWLLRTLDDPMTREKLQQLSDKVAVIHALKSHTQNIGPKNSLLAYELKQRFFQTVQPNYSADEIIKIYLLNVEKPLYHHAKRLIQKEAQNLGIATAMTPYSGLQMLLLIRWNLRVVSQLCALYGLKIGIIAQTKLIKMLWMHAIVDVVMDQVMNQVLKSISQTLMGKVIDQTSEAATSALLVYRIGNGLLQHLSLLDKTDKD